MYSIEWVVDREQCRKLVPQIQRRFVLVGNIVMVRS